MRWFFAVLTLIPLPTWIKQRYASLLAGPVIRPKLLLFSSTAPMAQIDRNSRAKVMFLDQKARTD